MEEVKLQQKETWEEYFSRLLELQNSCNKVLKVYETIENKVKGEELSEVLSSDLWKEILLGGLSGESFSQNGLGPFYQKLYGASFELPELVARLKGGIGLEEALRGLYGKVEKPQFIKLAEGIPNSLSDILQAKGEFFGFSQREFEETEFKDAFIGQKVAEEFLQNSLQMSLNSSEESFFIFSLDQISWRYMLQAYPWLEGQSFEFIKELLELSPIIEPEFPDERTSREYTVWGFEKGSIGESFRELITAIWDLTGLSEVQQYFGLQSERERYLEKMLPAWERAVPRGKEAEEIVTILKEVGSTSPPFTLVPETYKNFLETVRGRRAAQEGTYTLQGFTVSLGPRDYLRRVMPFSNLIDFLSPALYLNLGFIDRSRWATLVY